MNYTLGLNPTFSPIMTMAGASTLSVKGSEQGYQIDASQLSDNLQGYMNVNPGQNFRLAALTRPISALPLMALLPAPPSQHLPQVMAIFSI